MISLLLPEKRLIKTVLVKCSVYVAMFQMCLNPALAIHSRDKPPPLYICSDCAEVLKKDHSDYMMDILLPMSHVATKCENKVSNSSTVLAILTC